MGKNRFTVQRIWSKSDLVALFLAGVLFGALFLGTVLHFEKPTIAITGQVRCGFCHFYEPPIIKNLSDYKKAHPSPVELRKRIKTRPVDLAELTKN